MDEKVLLSSYVVKIRDNKKNYHHLSHIDGSVDFIKLFEDFTSEIYETIEKTTDFKGGHTTHLTLEEPINKDPNELRSFYGFFSSGVSGEKYKVIDTTTNEKELEVEPHHAAFRNVFFYLYVPKQKNKAYIVLQRKSNFGIKLRLTRALNNYLKKRDMTKFRIELDNVLHNKVYRRMMDEGRLKRVELIKNKIPSSIEKYIENNEELEEVKGTFKSSFTSRTSLPDRWKDYLDRLFKQRTSQNGSIEIKGLDNEYDDIEFELELNGKKKTFYMVNQQRIQPDVDITNNVEFKEGEPSLASLVKEAKELIDDITKVIPI